MSLDQVCLEMTLFYPYSWLIIWLVYSSVIHCYITKCQKSGSLKPHPGSWVRSVDTALCQASQAKCVQMWSSVAVKQMLHIWEHGLSLMSKLCPSFFPRCVCSLLAVPRGLLPWERPIPLRVSGRQGAPRLCPGPSVPTSPVDGYRAPDL